MNSFSEMTLDEITAKENISARTKNLCGRNKLLTLQAILDYWQNDKTFKNLIKYGVNTQRELIALCQKYSLHIITSEGKMITITDAVASFDP